jgi:hypothetical protein
MIKKLLIIFLFSYLLFVNIFAEEDPFAGLDFGDTTTSQTETVVSDNASQTTTTSAEEDIFTSMEADVSPTGEQVLLPEETSATATTTKTDEFESLFSQTEEKTQTTTAQAQPEKQAVKKEPVKKWEIKTIKSEPLTDFIYTKNGELGMFRNIKDHLIYDIKTTSNLSGIINISDNRVDTAWIENGKKEGIGEEITFNFHEITFAPVYEKKYRAIEVKEIKILNGFCKDEETWQKYNRAKKIKILLNNQVKYFVNLHDSKNWQIIKLPVPITIKSGDKIKIEIVDVYPEIRNARIANTAISEISLIGGPAGPQVENKYIASHLLVK